MINWFERWPSFTIEEILSDDQLHLYTQKGVFPYSFKALDKLQAFRNFVGYPLLINQSGLHRRGSRSIKEVVTINTETRGDARKYEYSFHLWCAFDVSCKAITIERFYKYAIDFEQWGGIGIYDTFLHLDDRDSISGLVATWDYRSLKK